MFNHILSYKSITFHMLVHVEPFLYIAHNQPTSMLVNIPYFFVLCNFSTLAPSGFLVNIIFFLSNKIFL
jgi:hypothetical protein